MPNNVDGPTPTNSESDTVFCDAAALVLLDDKVCYRLITGGRKERRD